MTDENTLIPNSAAAKTVLGLGAAGTATVLIFLINNFVDMKERIATLETEERSFVTEIREDEAKVLNRMNMHARRIDDLYRHLGMKVPME